MENVVEEKFDSYPDRIKPKMESLRSLIYEVADATDGVGKLEETLKWGEPAYLPSETKSGTTVRIGWCQHKSHTVTESSYRLRISLWS